MAVPTQLRGVLRFGVFEIDTASGELRKQGKRIRLQEQPLQVLALLLEHPAEVVTREELRNRLWSADTFVGFDDGLNTAIKKIRNALDDSAESPRFIETLPRHGYRFIGALQPPADASQGVNQSATLTLVAHEEPQLTTKATPRRWFIQRKFWIAALSLISLFVAVIVFLGVRRRSHAPAPEQRIQSLAVLPLENLSHDASQDYFADGMTDALITNLAQISSLRVISRTSIVPYKGSRSSLGEIGRKLNADVLVEGSVVRYGNRIRVTAQLVHAGTDRHLWAHSYEGDLRDVLALQDEVARDVTQQIRTKLTSQEQARLAQSRPVNPDAYDLYLRGRFRFYHKSREDFEAAIGLFEQAIKVDPDFALAHAYLALAYAGKAFLYQREDSHLEQLASAQLDQALALDPDLAEAHFARAGLLWTHSNHFPQETVRELHRALELNPNFDEAHQQLGAVYNHIGLLDKAAVELHKALELNPGYTGARFRLGINLSSQGKYAEALLAFEGTQNFLPAMWTFHSSSALFHLGRKQEAAALVTEFLKINPRDEGGVVSAMNALLLADKGNNIEARRMIETAITNGEGYLHFHHTAYAIGSAYAVMNQHEQAMKWLRVAADDGFPCYPMFENDSALGNLRADQQFISFLAGLKAQWERYKAEL